MSNHVWPYWTRPSSLVSVGSSRFCGRERTSKFPTHHQYSCQTQWLEFDLLAIKLRFDFLFPSLSVKVSMRASASTYISELWQALVSLVPCPHPINPTNKSLSPPLAHQCKGNSPLRHIHQIILLPSLHKTCNPKPTRLPIIQFAVIGTNDISHERLVVASDCNFLGRCAEAPDEGHAGKRRAGCA